jgi:iron complex outermembrane receptor protein
MNSKALNGALASIAALCAAPVALGQEAAATQSEADDLGEIVVSGYRASLSGALDIKRNSDLVVDAISGGDIGALPDVTIAESLVRLPGINGTRDRGNQSQAAMRGLGPRLVLGLVNGREVASSEPSRNVRWEIYPSEVVSGVDVYKSQSADLVAGGVAGTIDIKTIRPLNYSGPELLVRGGGVYYEAGGDIPDYDPMGYRGSGSYTHMIGDDFGFNLGVSAQQQKNAYPSFQGWGYNDGTINPGNDTGDLDGDGVPNPTPWGAQTEVKKLTEDRFGVNGAIGWRVGDNFELNIDALYSKFTIDEDQNQAWYGRNGTTGNWGNGSSGCYNSGPSSYTTVGETVVAATLDNCYASVTNVIAQYTEDKDLLVGGANAKWEAGSWTIVADVSHSEATRTNRWAAFRSEVYPATMTFDMSAGVTPSLSTSSDPSDPTIQSAPGWLTGISDGPDNLEDKLSAIRVDLKREFANEFELSFGARASDRSKDFFRRHQEYTSTVAGNLPADLFTSYSVTEFDAPPLLNGNFRELADFVYGGMPVDPDAVVQDSIWGVDESVLEGYVKIRFEGAIGSKPLAGNVGVRVVRTETESTGFGSVNGGALAPVDISNDYTEMLPSINFTFNLADDKLLRLGFARVISRPPLDELRASRQLWNSSPPPTGSGGNPLLAPFLANQLDLSYEYYFAPEALVSLAVYYKDVDTHIGYTTEPVTIDNVTYAVTGPFNGDGGGITGAEFTFQTPFSFIDALKNFGIYMNYAYVDTGVKEFYPAPNPLPIEGYAQQTATADLWFNKAGWEARLGYKYHTPFSIIAGWSGSDVRTLGEESILDFSTSWQVNDSFGVRLQINNLTNEPLRITRDNSDDRLGSYDVYGRRAMLDFTFKY